MIDSQTKTAIVLSGGGARGAFEAGVLSGLQNRVSFDIVCGTSIGSINAALTAQRAFDELAQLWQTISTLNVVRYIDVVQKVSAFVDDVEGLRGKPLAALGNIHLVNDWCKIGSKKALLALRGIYWKLYQLQYKDQEIPKGTSDQQAFVPVIDAVRPEVRAGG